MARSRKLDYTENVLLEPPPSSEDRSILLGDDSEQTQGMSVMGQMVEKHQNVGKTIVPENAMEELAIDVLTNFKALASRSTPKSVKRNGSFGKAYKAKRERKPSALRKEASKSKDTRKCFYPKSSRAYRLATEWGHKLLHCDIRVWWPADEMFYKGIIKSFDRSTNQHKVNYVDGDVEILDLTKECWHLADMDKLNHILGMETYEGPHAGSDQASTSAGSRKKRASSSAVSRKKRKY